jgi:hypothetical protein
VRERAEQDVLLSALRRLSAERTWREIRQGLLAAHGSTRTLVILRSLLRTTSQAGVRSFELLPRGELQFQFDVVEVRAVRQLVGQL